MYGVLVKKEGWWTGFGIQKIKCCYFQLVSSKEIKYSWRHHLQRSKARIVLKRLRNCCLRSIKVASMPPCVCFFTLLLLSLLTSNLSHLLHLSSMYSQLKREAFCQDSGAYTTCILKDENLCLCFLILNTDFPMCIHCSPTAYDACGVITTAR